MNAPRVCMTCGVVRYLGKHTCPPTWLVWSPDRDQDENDGASTIYETDPASAAEAWAERDDLDSAEHAIARGTPAVVHVRDPRTGEVTRWRIWGEFCPEYSSAQIENEAASSKPDGAR